MSAPPPGARGPGYSTPPAQAAALAPTPAPAPQGKADPPKGKADPKRNAMATLMEALSEIPAEEERTNPWEIPGDERTEDGSATTHSGRREPSDGGGKRKRSGKG